MKKRDNKINLKLKVKSSTENLVRIRDFIKDAAEKSGFSQDEIGKIILASDEACTNVIKHAYHYSDSGEINITINVAQKKFKISITDSGDNFDSKEISDPDLVEYHNQKRVGGLGMFLMKKLMDEVNYNKLSDNRNQVILVKYLT